MRLKSLKYFADWTGLFKDPEQRVLPGSVADLHPAIDAPPAETEDNTTDVEAAPAEPEKPAAAPGTTIGATAQNLGKAPPAPAKDAAPAAESTLYEPMSHEEWQAKYGELLANTEPPKEIAERLKLLEDEEDWGKKGRSGSAKRRVVGDAIVWDCF